jgi:hypothetical protein
MIRCQQQILPSKGYTPEQNAVMKDGVMPFLSTVAAAGCR